MFTAKSCTTQLEIWKEINAIKLDDQDSADQYIDQIKERFDQLDRINFKWTRDSIISLTLQFGLSKSRYSSNLLTSPTNHPIKTNIGISTHEVENMIRRTDEFYMSTESELAFANANIDLLDVKPPACTSVKHLLMYLQV